jgi:mannose-6-phosphate isomerase-like protein (cupin superfamily)
VLYAEIPDAKRLDPGFSSIPPIFNLLDWTREPVFKSQRDGRSRIALVNPEMCHTAAMKIEMVIYPPGSKASTYHHEGAESFVYIVSGSGNCRASERSFPVRQKNFIYFSDREPHQLAASDKCEMRFLVFYAPGAFKTVWADPSKKSAWVSTGLDINGYETAEDQRERRTFAKAFGGPITR